MTDTVYVLDEDGIPRPKPKEQDPMPATKKKTTKMNRWTETDIEMLRQAVASAPSARKAFEQVAAETGRSVGTIQQKWYALKRKSDSKPATGRVGASTPSRGRSRSMNPSSVDVRSMDTSSLVAAVAEMHEELRRRQSELAAAMSASSIF